ncbi:MAG: hypothetical protein LBU87_05465 [Lactobacillales bacterium]|jgi:aldose 1-epimerase|nr:hypothetical protein [Lactobacillales bacterium]
MSEIILENQFLKIGVLPECGASLSFFKYRKNEKWVDVLRPMNKKEPLDSNDASMFLMIPYCSRIRGGNFVYWGIIRKVPKNQYGVSDPIHGDAWKSEFEIVSKSKEKIVLKMTHDKSAGYPFSYEALVTYEIKKSEFSVMMEVLNKTTLPIPCGMGVHPFFVKTKDVELDYKTKMVWSNWSDPIFDKPYATPDAWNFDGGRPLKNAVFDTCFGGFDGKGKIIYPEMGITVSIDAPDIFRHVVLYAPKGKDFFCLEPASNAANAFNLAGAGVVGTGIQSIGPNQSLTGKITFDIQG